MELVSKSTETIPAGIGDVWCGAGSDSYGWLYRTAICRSNRMLYYYTRTETIKHFMSSV